MPDDASDWMSGFYEEYTGTDGQKHKTRVPTANMQWIVKATDNKNYYIKFTNNFAKKHLFTYTKKKIEPKDQLEANNAKFLKQAKHRTVDEQGRLCKTCGHEEKRHKTGSGNPAACKEPKPSGPDGKCGCTNFQPDHRYLEKRKAQHKPFENPLAGATTAKTTYIVMNEIPKDRFEKVLVDSITGAITDWAANTEKHLTWNFDKLGAVITVDISQQPKDWAKAKGVEIGVKNITSDQTKPTFEVFHLIGTV